MKKTIPFFALFSLLYSLHTHTCQKSAHKVFFDPIPTINGKKISEFHLRSDDNYVNTWHATIELNRKTIIHTGDISDPTIQALTQYDLQQEDFASEQYRQKQKKAQTAQKQAVQERHLQELRRTAERRHQQKMLEEERKIKQARFQAHCAQADQEEVKESLQITEPAIRSNLHTQLAAYTQAQIEQSQADHQTQAQKRYARLVAHAKQTEKEDNAQADKIVTVVLDYQPAQGSLKRSTKSFANMDLLAGSTKSSL